MQFIDLHRQYDQIDEKVKKGILNIIWQTDKGTYNFGG